MAGSLLLVGCSQAGPPPSPSPAPVPEAPATEATPTGPVVPAAAGDVVTGLAAPWSIAPLSADAALISLRNAGEVVRVTRRSDGFSVASAGTVPGVAARGEGGLMGLAVAPAGDQVYAMLTAERDNRVVRMAWDGTALGTPEPVLTGIAKGQIHNGGRIAFAPDGTLFVATGDAGQPQRSQDPDDPAGKILRIRPDGSVPADNPRPGSPVYSLGHRNVQGLAFDDTGRLWASEFGARDADEINLIRPGGNYGWPFVEGLGNDARFVDPVVTFEPTSTASPSGIAFAQGSLWVATLRGQTLYQIPLDEEAAGDPLPHFAGTYGRQRDVVPAPDGGIWLLTNNTDGRGSPSAGDDRIIALTLTQ